MMKVQVLMSVYNSVKFFSEQLDTVLAQKDVEISILIRDDGSKNSDMEDIISTYQKKHPNIIEYYSGDNLRPAASFLDLVKRSDAECDYYAFCDHDDLWDDDKLKCAVNMLRTLDNNTPNCCFCNYRICDAMGNIVGYSNVSAKQKFSIRNLLLSNPAPGCCIVFNRQARELIVARRTPQMMVMHDGWVILLCSMLGQVVFDGEPRISYRQHGRNTVGVATTWAQRVRFKTNYLMRKSNKNRHCRVFGEFRELYGKQMSEKENIQVLNLLCEYRESFWKRLKLVLTRKVVSYNHKVTLFFKVLILVNRW